MKIDAYGCAIKIMVRNLTKLRTVTHIPREISRHINFFPEKKSGKVDGSLYCVKYRCSPTSTDGTEIPLILNFKSTLHITYRKITSFYLYEYTSLRTKKMTTKKKEKK